MPMSRGTCMGKNTKEQVVEARHSYASIGMALPGGTNGSVSGDL